MLKRLAIMCIENQNKTFGFGLVMIWDHTLSLTMASLFTFLISVLIWNQFKIIAMKKGKFKG